MLTILSRELQSLRKEIEIIKSSNHKKPKLSCSEVDILVKENKCLKKEFEDLKRHCEIDKERFLRMIDERSQRNDLKRNVPSCEDQSNLSQGISEVMDVVTGKLQTVLQRFQQEEKTVCDASTSFTNFTNNYRGIIEDYCKTLSSRINEWFECKRRKFEKREEKLKKEFELCSTYVEGEKDRIKRKVTKINEKIDQYEKYIECQMVSILLLHI